MAARSAGQGTYGASTQPRLEPIMPAISIGMIAQPLADFGHGRWKFISGDGKHAAAVFELLGDSAVLDRQARRLVVPSRRR